MAGGEGWCARVANACGVGRRARIRGGCGKSNLLLTVLTGAAFVCSDACRLQRTMHQCAHLDGSHADSGFGQVSRWRIRVERHKGAVVVGCLVEPPAPLPGFARALVRPLPSPCPKLSSLSSLSSWLLPCSPDLPCRSLVRQLVCSSTRGIPPLKPSTPARFVSKCFSATVVLTFVGGLVDCRAVRHGW